MQYWQITCDSRHISSENAPNCQSPFSGVSTQTFRTERRCILIMCTSTINVSIMFLFNRTTTCMFPFREMPCYNEEVQVRYQEGKEAKCELTRNSPSSAARPIQREICLQLRTRRLKSKINNRLIVFDQVYYRRIQANC